ncbi:MAG: hypothetical protein AAFR91_00155 [Pseudomonadota bacterium]
MTDSTASANIVTGSARKERRKFLAAVLATGALGLAAVPVLAQAPPPPPPPRGTTIYRTGFLPTATDVMYALRRRVEMDREEAHRLEQLVANTLLNQRRLLLDFGINPDYAAPDIGLSYGDARQLNDEMDELMDRTEDAADDFLSRSQMRAFRELLREEESVRQSAINAMRR